MIPLVLNIKNRQIHRDRKLMRGYQGLGEGEMGSCCLMTTGFLFGVMKRFWKLIVRDAHIMNVINATESHTLKWQIFCYIYFTTIFKTKVK